MSNYIFIDGRDVAQFMVGDKEILVMIRDNKLRIEADSQLFLEMRAANTFDIIPDGPLFQALHLG